MPVIISSLDIYNDSPIWLHLYIIRIRKPFTLHFLCPCNTVCEFFASHFVFHIKIVQVKQLTLNSSMTYCEPIFCCGMSVQWVYTTASHTLDLRPGLTFIPISECELVKYKENPEDKALVGVLLKVFHYTGSSSDDKKGLCFNEQGAYQARGTTCQCNFGKRQYNHIFTFADVLKLNTWLLCHHLQHSSRECKATGILHKNLRGSRQYVCHHRARYGWVLLGKK